MSFLVQLPGTNQSLCFARLGKQVPPPTVATGPICMRTATGR
jgi:hypothetical protein